MEQIERYIDDIEVYQLEVDWNEICGTVPALRGKDWDISKAAIWFKLELKTSQKQSFLQSMEQLRSSLENYWRRHDLPEW